MPYTGAEHQDELMLNGVHVLVRSESMRRLLALAQRVAKSTSAVLIDGETGSGKEVVARAIHHFSPRAANPFIDLNCAALPEHLLESELFGYQKGAFSGADTMKPGLVELADNGTLFLDEVGDLDPKLQVKLLRVLEGASYYRLGGSHKVTVNIRLVAASNRDLSGLVDEGKFRSDLFHRLAQFQLHVPPLRERPEDIVAIAEQALEHHFPGSRFTPEALNLLKRCEWPGNIRQLKNAIFKAVMTAPSPEVEIRACDLQAEANTRLSSALTGSSVNLYELEKRTIFQVVETAGNIGVAAEQLGISRRTLERKLKLYAADSHSSVLPLGAMRPEQQRYFRASVNVPVAIDCQNYGQLEARTVNVSFGGICLQFDHAIDELGPCTLSFELPDPICTVEWKAELAWCDRKGLAGMHFVDLSGETYNRLEQWLVKRMRGEGWSLQS
jgi:transcriptional regulator with PAS, ATPase and Fis domain